MEAAGTSEMSANFYKTSRCYNPEENTFSGSEVVTQYRQMDMLKLIGVFAVLLQMCLVFHIEFVCSDSGSLVIIIKPNVILHHCHVILHSEKE
jgi:hypothetical protein